MEKTSPHLIFSERVIGVHPWISYQSVSTKSTDFTVNGRSADDAQPFVV
jgi:hypothetical protein